MTHLLIFTNSTITSIIGVIGIVMTYGGVISVLKIVDASEVGSSVLEIVIGIILAAIGVAISVWTIRYSAKKQFYDWKKTIETVEMEEQIRTDVPFAVLVFCTYPCKMFLTYITYLNPEAGAYITAHLQTKKDHFLTEITELFS